GESAGHFAGRGPWCRRTSGHTCWALLGRSLIERPERAKAGLLAWAGVLIARRVHAGLTLYYAILVGLALHIVDGVVQASIARAIDPPGIALGIVRVVRIAVRTIHRR